MSRAWSLAVVAGCLALAADGLMRVAAAGSGHESKIEATVSPVGPEEEDERYTWKETERSQVYAAVGTIKAAMTCTAAVVLDPQIVITAAHCILDENDRLPRARPSFTPAYDSGKQVRGYSGQVWTVGSWRQHTAQTVSDASHDWAIVVLDEALLGAEPLSVRSYEPREAAERGWRVILPSYSSDVAARHVLGVDLSCSVRAIAWEVLLHDCAASSGSSGAPLLMRDGETFAVIGVNTGTIALTVDAFEEAARIRHSAVGAWSFLPALRAVHARLMRREGVQCVPVC